MVIVTPTKSLELKRSESRGKYIFQVVFIGSTTAPSEKAYDVMFANTKEGWSKCWMPYYLRLEGVNLNTEKASTCNRNDRKDVQTTGWNIEKVGHYEYLGEELTIGKSITHLGGICQVNNLFEVDIPLQLKPNLYDQSVLLVTIYGAETCIFTRVWHREFQN